MNDQKAVHADQRDEGQQLMKRPQIQGHHRGLLGDAGVVGGPDSCSGSCACGISGFDARLTFGQGRLDAGVVRRNVTAVVVDANQQLSQQRRW